MILSPADPKGLFLFLEMVKDANKLFLPYWKVGTSFTVEIPLLKSD